MASIKTLEKKQHIIQIALEIFDVHGVENTTIEMICKATSTSIGSLYHHFGNKEGLAISVYLTGLENFSSQLLQQLEQCQTVHAAIDCIVDSNIDWIEQHPTWAKFIFEQSHVLRAVQPKVSLKQHYEPFAQKIQRQIMGLKDSDSLQVFPPEMLSALLVGAIHTYARQWLRGQQPTAPSLLRPFFRQSIWQSLQKQIVLNKN